MTILQNVTGNQFPNFKVIKGQNYDSNKFSNNKAIIMFSLKYPQFNLGFSWI